MNNFITELRAMKTKKFATYYGVLVQIVEEWRCAGGIAVAVRKPDDAEDWPWTISSFTTAKCNLEFAAPQA